LAGIRGKNTAADRGMVAVFRQNEIFSGARELKIGNNRVCVQAAGLGFGILIGRESGRDVW
jgi:hypothetical protein